MVSSALVNRLIDKRNERLRYFFQLADSELREVHNAVLAPLDELIAIAERRRGVEMTPEVLAERVAARIRRPGYGKIRSLALEFRPELEALGMVRPGSINNTVVRRFREFMRDMVRPLLEVEWPRESRRGWDFEWPRGAFAAPRPLTRAASARQRSSSEASRRETPVSSDGSPLPPAPCSRGGERAECPTRGRHAPLKDRPVGMRCPVRAARMGRGTARPRADEHDLVSPPPHGPLDGACTSMCTMRRRPCPMNTIRYSVRRVAV